MTLLELCDPLFKYVCFVNRSERKGAAIDPAQVDSDLETILGEIKAKAAGQANLADLKAKTTQPSTATQHRRNRILKSSQHLLGDEGRG